MRIDKLAILYRPSTDKPCTTCTFIDGKHCDMFDADTRKGMGCAMWLQAGLLEIGEKAKDNA